MHCKSCWIKASAKCMNVNVSPFTIQVWINYLGKLYTTASSFTVVNRFQLWKRTVFNMLSLCVSSSRSPDLLDGSLSSVGSSSDSPAKMEGMSPSSSNSPLTPLQDLSPKWSSRTSPEDWAASQALFHSFYFRSQFLPKMAFVLFLNCPVTLHFKARREFSVWDRPTGMERLWMFFASAAINRCKTWCIYLYPSEGRQRRTVDVFFCSIMGQLSFW